MKLKFINSLLIAAGLLTLTTACNDSNGEDYTANPYTSLVTYDMTVSPVENDVTKDIAYFTFYTDNNSISPIAYFSTGMNKKIDAQPGDRMIISYYLTGNMTFGQSGQISLYTYRKVPGGAVQTKPTAEAEAANAPMAVTNINRTSNYINLFVRMMNNPDRTFTMIADQETVDTGTVDMYVTTAAPASSDTGIINEQVASFDMGSIWRNANTMKVRIHVNNTNGDTVFEFSK